MAEKPSQLLTRYLSGEPIQDKAVKSWAQFFIYKKACDVLNLPFEKRRSEIDRSPLRDELAAEVVRVNKIRAKS